MSCKFEAVAPMTTTLFRNTSGETLNCRARCSAPAFVAARATIVPIPSPEMTFHGVGPPPCITTLAGTTREYEYVFTVPAGPGKSIHWLEPPMSAFVIGCPRASPAATSDRFSSPSGA